jgi:hypothetical protein
MAVTGTSARDSVGYFMEKNLVDVIVIGQLGEVAGNSDLLFVVVAGTKPGLRVVERKTPRLIKVESDERIGPDADPMKFSHVFRVGGRTPCRRELSTVSPATTPI